METLILAGQRILPQDGATLGIGPSGLLAIVQMSGIRPSEVSALRRGRLEIAVLGSGSTGFLLTRFASEDGRHSPIDLEMPFHVGLLPPDQRYIEERGEGETRTLLVSIQDECGRGHGGRLVTLDIPVCEAIERLVDRQAKESSSPAWTRRSHDREVEEFYRRYPDSRAVADKAFARALARMTVH